MIKYFGRICGHITSRKDAQRCIKCRIKFLHTLVGIKSPVFKGGLPNCIICGKKLSVRSLEYCRKHVPVKK